MRLLDLFCGAGGAAVGYHDAGFDEVVGIDIAPQPNYPFNAFEADALELGEWFIKHWHPDAIHASPPCQHFTVYGNAVKDIKERYDDLLAPTRELLKSTGLPYIIENVPGAPLENPITLCGSMFGLDVRRHRLFESNMPLLAPQCDHTVWRERKYPGATNRPNGRYTCEVGVYRIPLDVQKTAMGVDWDITLRELSEAIPPSYTEFIGRQLIDQLEAAA